MQETRVDLVLGSLENSEDPFKFQKMFVCPKKKKKFSPENALFTVHLCVSTDFRRHLGQYFNGFLGIELKFLES